YTANGRLYLRRLSELEARPIQGTELFETTQSPVFSPDGRSVAFFASSDQSIKRIPVAGGAAVTICFTGNPFGITWDRDGILYAETRTIKRVSENGGTPTTLVAGNEGELLQSPQLLPDGRHLLFAIAKEAGSDRWEKGRIVVQSLDSGDRKTLVDGGSDARYVPTGHLVYAWQGVLLAVRFDPRTLAVTSPSAPVLEGVRRAPDGTSGIAQFSFSSTGNAL